MGKREKIQIKMIQTLDYQVLLCSAGWDALPITTIVDEAGLITAKVNRAFNFLADKFFC